MALYGWTGDNGDPDNFLDVLLGCTSARIGGNNIARWCNRDYDKLVSEAKLISDQAAREELYRQAQVIFHDDAPWVPIAHSVVFMATRANVVGLQDGSARPPDLRGRRPEGIGRPAPPAAARTCGAQCLGLRSRACPDEPR